MTSGRRSRGSASGFTEAAEVLHTALAKALLERIKSGDCTAADLSVARQFLKDNGIDTLLRNPESPVGRLTDALPFKDPDLRLLASGE